MTPFDPRRMRAVWAMPVLLATMPGAAWALTADEVWQSWKNAGALVGVTVSAATEARDGGTLMLNGVSAAPAGVAGFTISDMTLAEQSDGSVVITPGADVGFATDDAEGSVTVKVAHDGLTLVARDEAGSVVYDYSAASLTADVDSDYPATKLGDGDQDRASAVGKVTLEGLSGRYSDAPGANRVFGMKINASRLAYDLATNDPGLPMKTSQVSDTADVAMTASVTLPQTMALAELNTAANFAKALQVGMAVTLTTAQGVSTGKGSQDAAFMPYEMTMTVQPGKASFVFDKDRLSLDSGGEGLDVSVTSTALPAPIRVTSGPFSSRILSPVMAADVAGDYALALSLSDLSINEEAWAMFDPGAALPRDPASLSVDVSGKARVDFPAIFAAEETGVAPPNPVPETLTITDLSAMIAGAAMAANGAFTFDTSSGVPSPLGEATVTLTGANVLIDKLIAAGLLAEADAAGPRMMMAMFFAAGAEPDTMTSKIEARAGNEIWVNGQRVQ